MGSSTSKRERLHSTIIPVLKCIRCEQSQFQLQQSDTILCCPNCQQEYPIYHDIPIMTLDPERAIDYPKEAMVEHHYSDQWTSLIDKAHPQLVLDFGSGNTPDQCSNLIKMEIFAFPNVDVVGIGEKVPFANNTFRTVFSGAVFEHVEDPFVCANEIYNILKDDGDIYIETAFLQPYHAYPNHYFNMTTQGLRKVMVQFIELDVGVQPHQNPTFMLSWILDAWAQKLSGVERESFLNASVSELINEYKSNVFSQRWMTTFSDRDREELACGVYFHGMKGESQQSVSNVLSRSYHPEVQQLNRVIQRKDQHITYLEQLIGDIERGRVMRLLNWMKRVLPFS